MKKSFKNRQDLKNLLELEFKSNHSIITKALKRAVKKTLPTL